MLGSLYSEQRTWLHGVSAAVKLVLLALFGTALLLVNDLAPLLALSAPAVLVFVSLGAATRPVRRLLVSLLLAALLVAVFHALVRQPVVGLDSAVRLVGAALLGLALTLTTSVGELLDVAERVLTPLQRFGVNPQDLSLRVALMLRFVEHFFVQWQRLDDAYRVRTGQRGGWRLLAPLTILMLVAARRVADTLQLRLGE